MRILITGAWGQLGHDCHQVLFPQHPHLLCYNKDQLDITNAAQVEKLFQNDKPDAVINCAAFTKVDACENCEEDANHINVEGPRILAAQCKKIGARLIHISTDYVFDGKKALPQAYNEDDAVAPISAYGRSKLAGEEAIMATMDDFVIVRTAWLYGINGPNFLKTMLKMALQKKPLFVVDDQFGSMTWTWRLALQIEKILESQARGIFHATALGHASWHEVAKYFLAKMQVEVEISPCTSLEFQRPAPRPKNSILENKALSARGINIMKNWQDDIDLFVLQYREQLFSEAKANS